MRRATGLVLFLLLASLILGSSPVGSPTRVEAATAAIADTPPNILFIITDDQRLESGMETMPEVRRLLGQGGTEFTNFNATLPLCCPSRGTFWSGRYAHNHGVRTNDSYPQQQLYDQTSAFQSYLRNAGYSTALVGKYWNKWPIGIAPPGYDRWAKFAGGYSDASWGVDGVVRQEAGYTTDLIGTHSIDYLRSFEQDDARPWLMYLAPQAPHAPMTPEAQYAGAPVPAWSGNPAVAETDKSDKPTNIACCGVSFTEVDNTRKQQLRTLMSVDDMVGSVFAELDALGETETTLAIYTSDNGYMWGEHGRTAKRVPYTQSFQVPFFLAWPGHVAEGARDARLFGNVDVAPTILEAAGITPTHAVDGVSMFGAGARERLLLEYFKSPDAPLGPWAATLTPTFQYTEWYNVTTGAISFREYYDLVSDPWQLVNLLADGNPGNDPDVATLHAQLEIDRTCVGSTCPGVGIPDTTAPTTPGQPTGASITPGAINLSWAASDDDLATVLLYRVYREDRSDAIATVASASSTTVSFVDTGLVANSTHRYQIEAFDGSNVSDRSPASDPITVTAPPPPGFVETFDNGFTGWSTVRNMTVNTSSGGAAPPSARAQVTGVAGYARHGLPQTTPSACLSEAVRLESIGSSNVALMKLSAGSVNASRIVVTPARVLRVRNDVTGSFLNTGPTLPSGWHTLELCTRVGSAGIVSARLDGASMGTWTGQNLGLASLSVLQILDDSSGRTFTADVDDVTVGPGP